jgi:hypothetical protein
MDVPAMVWYQGSTDDHVRWSERTAYPDLVFLWPEARVLDDRRTGNTPSIAGVGSGTCMAWRGGGDDQRIWWSRLHGSSLSPGGAVWSPQTPAVGCQTSTFPTLVTLGSRMFMFFKRTGTDSRGEILWSELRGDRWVSPVTGADGSSPVTAFGIAGTSIFRTPDGYSATENIHDGQVYLAWRRLGNDDASSTAITWASYDGTDTDAWVGPHTTDMHTNKVPAIASDGTNVYMAWRRVEDDHIAWSVLLGTQWREPRTLDDRRTAGGPALGVSAQGHFVMVWVSSTDDRLYWSRFQDGQWDAQQVFDDRRAFSDPTQTLDIRVGLA